MKSATFPPLRVDPALRHAAEEVLKDGETLSSFVEQSVRIQVQQRQQQEAFIARGLASRDAARPGGTYVEAETVLRRLNERLAAAKAKDRPE